MALSASPSGSGLCSAALAALPRCTIRSRIIPPCRVGGQSVLDRGAGRVRLSLVNLAWIAFRFRETLDPQHRAAADERIRHPLHALLALEAGRPVAPTGSTSSSRSHSAHGVLPDVPRRRAVRLHPTSMFKIFVFLGVVLILTQGGIVRYAVPRFGENVCCCRIAPYGGWHVGHGFRSHSPLALRGSALACAGSAWSTLPSPPWSRSTARRTTGTHARCFPLARFTGARLAR